MKKIILGLSIVALAATSLDANAQEPTTTTVVTTATPTQKVKYYFYPTENLYWNEATQEYVYYDEPSVKWLTVKTLPSTVTWNEKGEHYTVYYDGGEVWKGNADHKVKYKVKKDGTIKQKPKN